MAAGTAVNEPDDDIKEELRAFLPERIFDAHAHIWRVSDLHVEAESVLTEGHAENGTAVWRTAVERMLGKSVVGGLLFPVPSRNCDIRSANGYLARQLATETSSRGLLLVSPDTAEEQIVSDLQNPQMIGFKPYHCFSAGKITFDSEIPDFVPEYAWRLADRHGLIIMLHIVKDLAMADPGNQRHLTELCRRYPRAKCVLAHAARSFHAPHARAVTALRGLENVYFDLSAICEAEALLPVLHEFGPRKLMWGSDFPVSDMRGRAVSVGDGFYWMEKGTLDWNKAAIRTKPTLVGLESLRALKSAADLFGLNQTDIADIFFHNAMRLTGQAESAGNRTQTLYEKATRIIPGGTQLLSKKPERHAPRRWPAYFSEARGCEVWDLDGRHYYDMSSNGIGACLLGYRNAAVTRAVGRRLHLGSMSTLNSPEEVELTERLLEIHPWAGQARYTRSGGEACAVAARIARAATGRTVIAVCGYHGWHDWYLAANLGEEDALSGHLMPGLEPGGVPRELRGTTVAFRANDRPAFDEIIRRHGHELAAVMMEPCRYEDPEPGFLDHVRERTRRCGTLLIFDEITIGWRLHFGGAHLKLGQSPDIAVFAKALGNGHPIGAIIGTSEAMNGARRAFISSTNWTESIGPAASLATLEQMRAVDVPGHAADVGQEILRAWRTCGAQAGLPVRTGEGYPCLAHFDIAHEFSHELKTLYTVKMLERGFLGGPAIYPTLAHTPDIVELYTRAIGEVFGELADIARRGDVAAYRAHEAAERGFGRLN